MKTNSARCVTFIAWGLLAATSTHAWGVTVEEALRYVPVQKEVDYDRPSAKEMASCQVKREQIGDASLLVVRGPSGEILRCFADTNNDNKVDQWRYFRNGIESYRDIDGNFNGKADQYRWLGLSGMRWGLDPNEDGQIDRWKMISAEEVSAEIVGAIRDQDVRRFANVLIQSDEIDELGLNRQLQADLKARCAAAAKNFQRRVPSQRAVDSRSQWVHFSATRPIVLPSGTGGNSKDLFIYENVAAMLDKGQVAIGTLVRAGDQWRAIDIPLALMDEKSREEGSTFLLSQLTSPPEPNVPVDGAISKEIQSLVAEIDQIEKSLVKADGKEKTKLYDRQVSLLRELASSAKTPEEQANWIRQLAETAGTAVQTGHYAVGVQRLQDLYRSLEEQAKGSELAGYVRFRAITAEYAVQLADPNANFKKVQDWWLEQLEGFVKDFPKGDDAVEAMLQLAIAEELAGNEKPAIRWYQQIIAKGGEGLEVAKAKGAQRRLTSVGNKLKFGGRTIPNGKPVEVSQLAGRFVLIHYWATWCDPCKKDIESIGKLFAKYGKNFVPIGVNLDSDKSNVASFLSKNRLPWPQIYEEGGLDSPPAVELGILTVPTMLLLDEDGKVVNRNIHITELEEYLSKNDDS